MGTKSGRTEFDAKISGILTPYCAAGVEMTVAEYRQRGSGTLPTKVLFWKREGWHRTKTMRSAHKTREELVKQRNELFQESRKVLIGFLMADLDISLTIARNAVLPDCSPQRKANSQGNARRGYESISSYLNDKRTQLSEEEREEFASKLGELRGFLERLGEEFAES